MEIFDSSKVNRSEQTIFKADYLENGPTLQRTGILEKETPIFASISSTC
ncbi:hypothetical protein Bateq7PJ16_4455 [Bacillus subtilis]|nr:hypothetical protein Bateq7PJ16_4455 [Bacillus subtilis]